MNLFRAIQTQSKLADEVIVMFSTGKESVVCLDLCKRYFRKISACFMYYVPNLEFQERTLQYYERRYNIDILRVPHFELPYWYRRGILRAEDYSVPELKISDIYNAARAYFDIDWIVAGETINDSRVRRAMIKCSGSIDNKRKRFFPLADWKREDVRRYIEVNKLKYCAEYPYLKRSMKGLAGEELSVIKEHFPADYEKILQVFPLAEAEILRWSIRNERGVCGGTYKPVSIKRGGVQSEKN